MNNDFLWIGIKKDGVEFWSFHTFEYVNLFALIKNEEIKIKFSQYRVTEKKKLYPILSEVHYKNIVWGNTLKKTDWRIEIKKGQNVSFYRDHNYFCLYNNETHKSNFVKLYEKNIIEKKDSVFEEQVKKKVEYYIKLFEKTYQQIENKENFLKELNSRIGNHIDVSEQEVKEWFDNFKNSERYLRSLKKEKSYQTFFDSLTKKIGEKTNQQVLNLCLKHEIAESAVEPSLYFSKRFLIDEILYNTQVNYFNYIQSQKICCFNRDSQILNIIQKYREEAKQYAFFSGILNGISDFCWQYVNENLKEDTIISDLVDDFGIKIDEAFQKIVDDCKTKFEKWSNFYKKFTEKYGNKHCIDLSRDKEKLFTEYEQKKTVLSAELQVEYDLVYSYIIGFYKFFFYIRNSKTKLKPTFTYLSDFFEYFPLLVKGLVEVGVIEEKEGLLYFSEISNIKKLPENLLNFNNYLKTKNNV